MEADVSTLSDLSRRAEELGRVRRPLPSDPTALALRCSAFRRYLLESLGYMPPRETDLSPTKEDEEPVAEGVIQERITYLVEPGKPVSATVCRPSRVLGRLPAILVLHAWNLDKAGLESAKVELARSGYVVLTPRPRCSEERDLYNTLSAGEAAKSGITVMGMITFDNTRALDYLSSREDVDPERIACIGLCWSGIQCYILAAVDERVRAACPVCGICMHGALPTQNIFLGGHACIATFIPGLLEVGQVQDIMALVAPRPLLIQNNVSNEWLPILGFRTAEQELTTVYRALGFPERFQARSSSGPEDMTPEFTRRIIEWLGRFLQSDD